MATTGLATAQFTAVMKTLYLDPLEDAVVRASVMLQRLEKNSEDIEGNHAYVAVETTRNPSVGFRKDQSGDGPHLPPAGRGGYANVTYDMGFHYLRGQISGPVMRRSKSSKGAFAKALDREMRNLMKTGPEDLNRKIWSSGNGRGASINTTQGSATTVTCDARDYFTLKEGDRVHISDSTTWAAKPAAGTTVVAITRDSATNVHTVELAAAPGVTINTTDAIYFGAQSAMVVAESSYGQTMHGIPDAVNDGAMGSELNSGTGVAAEYLSASLNFGGEARATSTWWQSHRLGNSGTLRPLTHTLLQQAWATAAHKGGADPSMLEIYTNPGMFTTAGLLVVGDRRLDDSMELVSGFTAMKFNGSKFFVDRDAPRNIIWFLDMSSIFLLTQGGYEFLDDDGSTLRSVADRDAWEFTLARDINLGARACHRSVILDDIEQKFHVEANV